MAPLKKAATYQDIIALPENLVGQLVDGDLIVHPRPTAEHARAQVVLAHLFLRVFDRGLGGSGGWWILPEVELHFGRDVLVPDLSGWRRERLPGPPRGPYLEVAPDWICEVLSPGTATFDRGRKLARYARAGVSFAWLVDPALRTLEVFRRGSEGKWVLLDVHDGAVAVRAEPFEAVEFDLGTLWLPDESG